MSESFQALSSVKLIILACFLQVNDRGYLSKGEILIIDLVKKISSILVEYD